MRLFEGLREPMRLARLDSGHLVLLRRAVRDGERMIQGLLLGQRAFLDGVFGDPHARGPLASVADLTVAHSGALLTTFRATAPEDHPRGRALTASGYDIPAQALTGALLHRARLSEPFAALELVFSVRRLPPPTGASVVLLLALALAAVVLGGTWLLWRLAARQIALASQQQAFVAAVSHELRTPLTSIRMYAEMLAEGVVPASRSPTYYAYLREESERLSRLIGTVLELSRLSRGTLQVETRPVAPDELLRLALARIRTPVEAAGFTLAVSCPEDALGLVQADPDAFVQVVTNLVDNALKFAAASTPRRIELSCSAVAGGGWCIAVRDYGPGIPARERRRVFRMFERGGAAVREAVPGTGIGLALVDALTRAMGGRVSAIGRDPGLEMRVELRGCGSASVGD